MTVGSVLSGCASPSVRPAAHAPAARLDHAARQALDFAAEQYLRSATTLDPVANGYPRATEPADRWRTVPIRDWTSGFFPGTLWYLFEHTGDGRLKAQAERWTLPLARIVPEGRYTHDLGFQYMSSFGNAYRITGDDRYRPPILDAARALAGRYNPTVGAIRSWDGNRWQYPVIIDNMMNLELLTWAARQGGDPGWRGVAVRHAETTRRNHFRRDHGSYHVIGYDSLTGAVLQRHTHQGYQHESTWARGQAWGIYGFTMMYRETGNPAFLQTARDLAGYVLPRLPADFVPCWDYQAPGCPATANRDASAGAITASGLLELSQYVADDEGRRYRDAAEGILLTLASSYLAKGTSTPSILLHSVGHLPAGGEVDVGISYADYYFVEALLRYLELRGVKSRAVLPHPVRTPGG